jgi:uncharacterized protein YcfL
MKNFILITFVLATCSCSDIIIEQAEQQVINDSLINDIVTDNKTEEKVNPEWESRQPIGFTGTVNEWINSNSNANLN